MRIPTWWKFQIPISKWRVPEDSRIGDLSLMKRSHIKFRSIAIFHKIKPATKIKKLRLFIKKNISTLEHCIN